MAVLSSSSFGQQDDVAVTEAAVTKAAVTSRWFRHVFNVNSASGSESFVGLSDFSGCRIWLNGQRLRPDAESTGAASFRVTELLRGGANCLAIESRGTGDVASAAIRVGAKQPQKIACRMKATMPPVGWQKTDFNDRDWKATSLQLSDFDWKSVPASSLMPKQTASRIQGRGFQFHDGDHVVLLGGTFLERAQQFGHLEAALLQSTAKNLTFRNLGWSADTVFAESRGIFDSPAKGYARMIEHLRAEEPDVVVIHYGQNEALQEKSAADFEKFERQLLRLISDIKVTTAEVVLVTPHPLLSTPPPLPDASMWNDVLLKYSDMVEAVAGQTGCYCVDLFDGFEQRLIDSAETVGFWQAGLTASEHPDLRAALFASLSDNGMHWNSRGYRCVSLMLAESLFGTAKHELVVAVETNGTAISVSVSEPAKISVTGKTAEIQMNRPWLQPGAFVVDSNQSQLGIAACSFVSEGNAVSVVSMLDSDDSPQPSRFMISQDYDRFVELLVRKNELYFHRWRPQNITYLFGFRKHEQGNNASEIAEYDPLIADYEKQIQALINSNGPTIRLELE